MLPGDPAFRLVKAVRADGTEIPLGPNLRTTDRTFLLGSQRPVYENRVHLFDKDGTSTYTLVFEAVSLPPVAVQQVGAPIPSQRTTALDAIDVTFSRAIDPATLDAADPVLTRDGARWRSPGRSRSRPSAGPRTASPA